MGNYIKGTLKDLQKCYTIDGLIYIIYTFRNAKRYFYFSTRKPFDNDSHKRYR